MFVAAAAIVTTFILLMTSAVTEARSLSGEGGGYGGESEERE
jgi:hypothetical protein